MNCGFLVGFNLGRDSYSSKVTHAVKDSMSLQKILMNHCDKRIIISPEKKVKFMNVNS